MLPSTKKIVYTVMEKVTVRVLLHLLRVSGGFASFLISAIVAEAFDVVVIPLINSLIINGRLYVDQKQGKIKVKRLNDARRSGNASDYDRAADDILS